VKTSKDILEESGFKRLGVDAKQKLNSLLTGLEPFIDSVLDYSYVSIRILSPSIVEIGILGTSVENLDKLQEVFDSCESCEEYECFIKDFEEYEDLGIILISTKADSVEC